LRAAVVSERLGPPFDEGVKNVALNLVRHLGRRHEVLALTTAGADLPELGLEDLPAVGRLFHSRRLRERIRSFKPERLCYLPTASMTPWSFLRARSLGRHGRGAPVTMIALQPRPVGMLTRAFAFGGAPDTVLVQSASTARLLAGVRTKVRFVPVGVDRERFAPVEPARRETLRHRFGVHPGVRVVLHVGHLNTGRNVLALREIQRLAGVTVVLAASRSTPHDPELVARLEAEGVHVVTETLGNPEALYQMADLYVFPCPPEGHDGHVPAIDIPLSVLEAMACDLPVVTTRFGGLQDLFAPGHGLFYVEKAAGADEWRRAVLSGLEAGRGHTRGRTLGCSWERFAAAAIGRDGGTP
jgi:glycosyltransferase involved in cell wall biosynthesis